jgi:glutamate decarboxylase
LLFAQANSLKADYLFHGNPFDLGAGTMGCGRRPDATKMFLAWKFYGQQGFGDRVDRALRSANEFTQLVKDRSRFVLVKNPSPFLQVCFWFVPQDYQGDLSVVTRELHRRVNQSGEFLVDHAPLVGQADFFRIVINAPTVSVHRDLERLLDAIEEANTKVDWSRFEK